MHFLYQVGWSSALVWPQEGRIVGLGDAEGRCVAARDLQPGSPIDCPPCDPADPRQLWQLHGHAGEEGSLVLEAFPKLCLVAGDQSIVAGPFVKRSLYLEMCGVVPLELRTWEVVE